jgi:[protein-PII] uridylyltransferase
MTVAVPRTGHPRSRVPAQWVDNAALAEWFVEQRARIRQENESAPRGRATCHALADLTDGVIRELFRRALPSRGRERVRRQLAVVATGGYGRRELCPYSDIDVTFIVAEEEDPLLDESVRQLFLSLMEVFTQRAQLKVGYAYRTVQDCEQLDHQTQTALLDARLLAGSRELLVRFQRELEQNMWPGAFVRQKLRERAAQALKHGDTIFLVEPQIREGPGGLRDLHVAEWLARVAFQGGEWDPWRRLVRAGAISREEATAAAEAREFYLALRNWMHFQAGRPADLLTRDRQEDLAAAMGYQDEPPVAAVELLMRDGYRHAERVRRIYRQVEEQTLQRRLRLDPELDCAANEVSPTDPRADVRRPLFLMDLCRHYQEHGLVPSPALASRVAEAMESGPGLSGDVEAGQLFLQLLGGSRSVSATLELMVSLGMLQRLIPELGEAFRRVPLDAIHKHTVGYHSLLVAEALDALRDTPPEQGGDFRRVFDVIDSPQLLFLAALLHDLGKLSPRGSRVFAPEATTVPLLEPVAGREPWAGPRADHSVVGAELALTICGRLGLDADAAERVSRLIRHHLLMSRTSQLRDLTMPQTIRDFVAVIENPDLLSMLFLLTYADMKATGVMSPVRVRFLEDLFYRAEQAMNERFPEVPDPERLSRYRSRLSRQLSDHRLSEEEIRRHCEGMPVSYLLNTSPDQIAAHVRLVELLRTTGPVVEFAGDLGPEISVISVCTYDDPQPGLLSRIAGVLYAHEIGVHAAQVFTREGEPAVALDTLWLDFHGRALPPLKKMELETDLVSVLRGRPVDEVLAAHRKHLPPGIPPDRVRFDNDLAEHHTVVELDAPDQPGLLYRLTRAMSRLGWDIHSARISTTGDRARDAFYITDRTGTKITGDPAPLQRAFIEASLAP